MTLFQMEVLVAVANIGNFTRAGEEIGLSQSGVSHTIGSLEKELGISLFVRNRTGVTLTAAGEEIVSSARVILAHSSRIKEIASQSSGLLHTTIRIGSFPSATEHLVLPLIRELGSLHPHLETRLFEGTYPEIKEWIRTGVIDVGFHVLPEEGLDGMTLMQDPLTAVVSAQHPLAKEGTVTFEQLAQEPFIMPMAGCELLLHQEFGRRQLKPQIKYEVVDNATILAMVEAGIGVTVVPTLTLPPTLPQVKAIELSPPVYRQIGLVVRSLHECSPSILAFLREAERFFSTFTSK
ncbi:LysR family transcriptional regulator [Brevibacillus choshinensis]|uniref:LysR family transcriptional regulator n=1 Tax=Brevibacillus choshinensis TaxID=54911 RepID=A0ABX7FUS6_BRECH|nr:LysR family transcriptional regulator [Brevibacillus choshinensis]QRG69357.1 LysR family transcriptional regulator [Brevibacillus choshinensis]